MSRTHVPSRADYLNLAYWFCLDVLGADADFPQVYYERILAHDEQVIPDFVDDIVTDGYFEDLLAEADELGIQFSTTDISGIAEKLIREQLAEEGEQK